MKNQEWNLIDVKSHDGVNKYLFWKYYDKNTQAVYNVTKTFDPPKNKGGYFGSGYVYNVKGFSGGAS